AEYPTDIISKMEKEGALVDALDCLSLAEEAGSAKAVNIVLLGKLSKYFDFSEDDWMASVEACVPPKFLEINKKAFLLGAEH
nr:2-oxoacid:acceptor oxidoreductase family protein [Lachnospiraceae bacterium]